MKVNLKKIGAFVAGAAILASSVGYAGLWFGSTELVNDNGAPQAKVVVGENAAASDGVAAALIASKLASAAYKTSNITASVSGTATCSAGTGGGNCTVSGESVTLEVTVPGSVAAGTYTVNNLIGDYLNRDLLDRGMQLKEYNLTSSDTSDPSNPFGTTTTTLGQSYNEMYRISGSMFSPFVTSTISDGTSGKSYSEMQDIWMKGENRYSDSKDDVIGKLDWLAYTLKFKGTSDDFGIPVCTTPTNSTLYATCADDYLTSAHKVEIKFLGEDWIISEMSNPTSSLTNENNLATGGYVKLAKESVAGILNQGESLEVDDLTFQLDDLEAHGETTSAIFSVLDANGNVKKKDTVAPGITKEFSIDGTIYRLHVYKVAPGYTFGAKWADVAIYSKELKLQHGTKLDPDYDTNKYWTVYLGWKNKGATTTDTTPDHLRTIILYADDMSNLASGGDSDMKSGDYIPLVQDPVKWKLSYNGLDIDSSNRNALTFTIETTNRTLSTTNGPMNATDYNTCNITAPFVKVKSGEGSGVFEVAGTYPGTDNEFWVAVGGASCAGGVTSGVGSLFIKQSYGGDHYAVTPYAANPQIKFSTIGDGYTSWTQGGLITYANISNANNDSTGSSYINTTLNKNLTLNTGSLDWVFGISENAGEGTSLGMPDKMLFGLDTGSTPSDADFNIDVSTAASAVVFKKDYMKYYYAGPVGSGTTQAEEGFITERGSVFKSIDKSSVQFDMADDLAHAQWYLASVSSNATVGTTQLTLDEGETGTVSSVTIKAKSIDETATCAGGAGGSPACTPNMTGVTASLLQDGSVVSGDLSAAVPYGFSKYTPLVLLDSDAVGVSTVISVGGDAVNTVTKSILSGTTVDWDTESVMVKEVVKGSKIVVAGKTAADTTEAASEFLANLTES